VFIIGLCAVFILGQWGCATQPPALSEELQIQLGTIGVVSAQYTPAVEFELPAKGWLGGARRGAVEGTKTFIVLIPSGAVVAVGSFGLLCCTLGAGAGHGLVGALWAAALLVKGTGYMIIGPFYGAATAEAPATVEEAETHLKESLTSMDIQESMRNKVVWAAKTQSNVDLRVLDGQGPESSSDLLTYFPLPEPQMDSVLELRVTRLWLSSSKYWMSPLGLTSDEALGQVKPKPSQELQINPPLSLGMEVRGRLIRTADKVVLYDNTWKYEGGSRLFTEWAANDAKLFAEEFERAYDGLAGQVVTSIF
jgi:hypothetical protein